MLCSCLLEKTWQGAQLAPVAIITDLYSYMEMNRLDEFSNIPEATT